MRSYYKNLSRNLNIDLHIDKNYYIFNDIIPLSLEEKIRYNESYKAFIMGLIFDLFEIATETDSISGQKKAVYSFTLPEGITVKRTEQLGIESRLINRLYDEDGHDSLRNKILKKAESVEKDLLKSSKYAELLLIYEYYFENVYKLEEIAISGEAKKKNETYQYKVVRELARKVENIIPEEERDKYISKVQKLKSNPDSFSKLSGDGLKRILRVKELLNDEVTSAANSDVKEQNKFGISYTKLKELKKAFDDKLITQEEYEKAKNKFLNT